MNDHQVAEVSAEYLVDTAAEAVPAGYKKTEVGVIPEDWDVSPLRALLKENPKYGINAPAVQLAGALPVYIRITDINEDFAPRYLFYILTSRIFDEFINRITAGSTITHLYQKDFVKFDFFAPGIEEQTAIAAILSDMDEDIEALEQRLAKTRQIKQGMMQELLTGKTRLAKSSNEERESG